MKKRHVYIGLIIIVAITLLMVAPTYVVHAATDTTAQSAAGTSSSSGGGGIISTLLGFPNITVLLATAVAWIVGNVAMYIMSWWVYLTGMLLSVSITMTLHIKDFVNSTQGVYLVWQTVRDLCGIFVIFSLLWASFRIILGMDEKIGTLIRNIVIAGIMINFSFFVVSVLIDASNIVSLSIYNGIAPGQDLAAKYCGGNANPGCLSQMAGGSHADGGISNILMNSLKITSILKPQNLGLSDLKDQVGTLMRVILIGVVGVIIMFVAGLSFAVMSLAFVFRLAILLFLLAFSPIWFAGSIVPGLDEWSKKFWDQLKAQLVFMPVYLLLLYAALLFLTKSNVIGNATSTLWTNATTSSWVPTDLVVLIINYTFAIIILNIPLVVAVSLSGKAASWVKTDKIGAAAIWKKVGGYVGTRTAGRAGEWADKKLGNTKFGNSLLMRDVRSGTTGALANAKMGASRSHTERMTAQKDVAKRNAEIDRRSQFHQTLAAGGAPIGTDARGNPIDIGYSMGRMSSKERTGLDIKHLEDPNVIKHLKKADFDAIDKADESEISEDRKQKIFESRKAAFLAAIDSKDSDTVKTMAKQMDTDELVKMVSKAGKLNDDTFIENLTPGNLKDISEKALLGDAEKRAIGSQILMWSYRNGGGGSGPAHKAFSFVDKNHKEWV